MSFYRKYRPQVIDEVDNIAVREKLLLLLKKDKKDLPHAYLLTGPKGTGKTTAARLIAKLFNCKRITKSGPCGHCEACLAIAAGSYLDVLEIDAASNRGIDEIRQLRERISLAPVTADYKIYIIDEVHMLTTEAFNALLKTLEEPPAHAVFVLATTDVGKVPATIVSRCLVLPFQRATHEELIHVLWRVAKKEKLNVEEAALTLVADYADGSFRDATKILEQLSFHPGKITEQVVRQTLSLSEEKKRQLFLKSLVTKDAKAALVLVGEIVKEGGDIKSFLIDCLSELEQLLVGKVSGRSTDLWTSAELREAIRRLTQAFVEMKSSPISQLPLELAVVEFCENRGTDAEQDAEQTRKSEETSEVSLRKVPREVAQSSASSLGLLTIDKLTEHWSDFIASTKPYNHSVAGVLRSSRPKAVEDGIVTIEAFYKFHQEKLSEGKTRQMLAEILKKLFGEKVKVEIVLGKK